MNAPLLKVDGLNAFYGRAQILFDVSLEVGRGEVVALMGRNGAGKSTTMKSIMGLMARREGVIHFDGADISALPPHRIARMGLGYVPEDRRVFSGLTVMENLDTGRQPARAGAPASSAYWVSQLPSAFATGAGMPVSGRCAASSRLLRARPNR